MQDVSAIIASGGCGKGKWELGQPWHRILCYSGEFAKRGAQ
jgi:hypothetical protein